MRTWGWLLGWVLVLAGSVPAVAASAPDDPGGQGVGTSYSAAKKPKAPSVITAQVSNKTIVKKKTKPRVSVRVTVRGKAAKGFVKVWSNNVSYQANLRAGRATIRMQPYPHAGRKRVRAKFFGDGDTKKSRTIFYVRIERR